jgi:hypothetical protein
MESVGAPVDQAILPEQLPTLSLTMPLPQINSFEAVIVGVWPVLTLIVKVLLAAHAPIPHVAVYVVVAVGETVIELSVEPVFQVIPEVQLVAVNTVLSPEQISGLEAVMVGVWLTLIVIVLKAVPVHVPDPHVTEYVEVAVGFTVIPTVVEPLFQDIFPEQLLTERVTGEPLQTLLVAEVIVGTWLAATTTVTLLDTLLEQEPILHVPEYVVVSVGVTFIDAPVMPLLQFIVPPQAVDVRVTSSPEQILLLEAAIVGVVGLLTIMLITFDSGLTQVDTLHVAVYDVLFVGLTTIEISVWLLDHSTVPLQPVAVNVALWPRQIEFKFELMTGVAGLQSDVTVIETVSSSSSSAPEPGVESGSSWSDLLTSTLLTIVPEVAVTVALMVNCTVLPDGMLLNLAVTVLAAKTFEFPPAELT